MPEFQHPSYAATAKTLPKQLNRWLDVNAQNGPLERNQAYFVLPAFNQAVTWLGYSDIVLAYNFEGPNNFSLKYLFQGAPNKGVLSPIPSNPNYSLAVAWIDKTGKMQRRFLWIATGAVFYFATQLYANEKVLKNFRLEVWSTNVANATQAAPLTLFTSVRGTQDYRFGTDYVLVSSDAAVTNFSCNGINNGSVGLSGFIKVLNAVVVDLNGEYVIAGQLHGKNYYMSLSLVQLPPPTPNNIIFWDGAKWLIQDPNNRNFYQSAENVATPDLVVTWTVSDFGALPIPTVKKTYDFALPLTFPANSVSQAN